MISSKLEGVENNPLFFNTKSIKNILEASKLKSFKFFNRALHYSKFSLQIQIFFYSNL